jgi:hypothetical protein
MNERVSGLGARMQLKFIVRRAMENAGGPNYVATHTRVSASHLSEYGNPNLPCQIPLDVAHEVDLLIGEPVIARELAAMEGYDLVPRGQHAKSMNLLRSAGRLAAHSGELVATAIESMHDNKTSTNEAFQISKEAAEVRQDADGIEQAAIEATTKDKK